MHNVSVRRRSSVSHVVAFNSGGGPMNYNRRAFLKKSITGAAVTMVSGAGLLKPKAVSDSFQLQDISKTSDEERKQLIAEAQFGRKTLATSNEGMVICSHPLATREAVKILKSGGNACDAALCASITQTVIEPNMTGVTGVLALLHYEAATKKATYLNGRWNPTLKAAVDVPGYWAGFEQALKRHGSKPKKEIMAPAIRYARDGFEIHPFLWGFMFDQIHLLGRTPQGREIYMPQNELLRPGDMIYQKRAADTLEHLVEEGSDFFYRGEYAEDFCRVIQEAGGVITRRDMEAYKALWQEPEWGTYREYEVVCDGSGLIDSFSKIESLDIQKLGPPTDSPETLYQMMCITTGLGKEGEKAEAQDLSPSRKTLQWGENGESYPGTCTETVVDTDGNIAVLLHSSNAHYYSGLFVRGLCLMGGQRLLVKPRPDRRPPARSLNINIIFKNKKPLLASGSPSISLLPNIIQNTTNILDFGIPIEESVCRPRFGGRSHMTQGTGLIEVDIDERVRKGAEEKGLRFDVVNPWNRTHGSFEGVHIDAMSGVMSACGDPRRCSKAEGV